MDGEIKFGYLAYRHPVCAKMTFGHKRPIFSQSLTPACAGARTAFIVKTLDKPVPLRQSEVWEELEAYARAVLVREMRQRRVSYANLSKRLAEIGIHETPDRLNRKVNRLKFQASFLMACLKVLELPAIDLLALDLSRAGREARLKAEGEEAERIAFRRRAGL
jgi:hypothetical protein